MLMRGGGGGGWGAVFRASLFNCAAESGIGRVVNVVQGRWRTLKVIVLDVHIARHGNAQLLLWRHFSSISLHSTSWSLWRCSLISLIHSIVGHISIQFIFHFLWFLFDFEYFYSFLSERHWLDKSITIDFFNFRF